MEPGLFSSVALPAPSYLFACIPYVFLKAPSLRFNILVSWENLIIIRKADITDCECNMRQVFRASGQQIVLELRGMTQFLNFYV